MRNDTAMTGEISLRGLVLPVGGIKEKVLAAMRAGITTVMLPKRNQKDLQDVPEEARQKLSLRLAGDGGRRGELRARPRSGRAAPRAGGLARDVRSARWF